MEEQISTYGLIGFPLEHSLSPLMHNAAFAALELDATYRLFPLKEEEFKDFFDRLKDEHSPIFGLNVTVPYKEKVIPYLDSVNPYVQKIKAVNTIVVSKKRRLQGFNTDGPGFLAHIKELGFDVAQKRIAILGAGGAARAVLSSLCLLMPGPRDISIYDNEIDKADHLVRDLSDQMNLSIVRVARAIDDLDIDKADLLINATPVGLKNSDPCLIDEDLLHPRLMVYDLIYNPQETALLKMAKNKGAKVSNGLGMLFFQGVLAFQHWAGVQLPPQIKNKMRYALEQGLKGK
jgi:shikimate dehydrogenase